MAGMSGAMMMLKMAGIDPVEIQQQVGSQIAEGVTAMQNAHIELAAIRQLTVDLALQVSINSANIAAIAKHLGVTVATVNVLLIESEIK